MAEATTSPRMGLRVHGDPDGDELARLGIEAGRLLDFSVNVSPFGPHPDVVLAAREAALDRYPDTTGRRARHALSEALDRQPDEVVLGHGAADLIWTIVRRFALGQRVLLVGPTFSEPRAAAEAHGCEVLEHRASGPTFAFDPQAIDASIANAKPALVYVCQPNNPTGTSLSAREIATLAANHASTTFLVDQAFLSLSARHDDARVRMPENAILVRSMTKDHALPGLRIAYALAAPDVVRAIEASRPPWMTSAPAQAAIVEAVRHPEHVRSAREALLGFRAVLTSSLEALGIAVVPSEATFALARLGHDDSNADADALRARLLARHAILVRSGASFGLPDHVRLCARPNADVSRLVAALREELDR